MDEEVSMIPSVLDRYYKAQYHEAMEHEETEY